MRPKGSVREIEARRREALKLLEQKLSLNEVARRLKCHPSSVMRWRDRFGELGEEGLKAQSPPGRPSLLNEIQKQELLRVLTVGPVELGYGGWTWTTQRVAEIIAKRFGISYHRDHVGKLLHLLGWSYRDSHWDAVARNRMAAGETPETQRRRGEEP